MNRGALCFLMLLCACGCLNPASSPPPPVPRQYKTQNTIASRAGENSSPTMLANFRSKTESPNTSANPKPKTFLLPAFALLAFLLFGCLSTPKPFNETGFLPPIQNYSAAMPSPLPSGADFGAAGPSVCNMQAGSINMTIFIQGTSMRSESFSRETNQTTVTIMKGSLYYEKGGQSGTPFENCSWVLVSADAFAGNYTPASAASGQFSTMNISPSMPDCRIGNFSSEIFEVNGTVCKFDDVMGSALYQGMNCDTLSDMQARDECRKYQAG